jgi:hypothetical protein
MNDVDMNDMFAMKLQSIIRRFNSRCRVIRIINDRYEKILDPRRKVHYYYDKIADISTWIKPPLLGKGDIEKISPTYTDDKAAEIITNLFRALYSLRKVQRLYAERVEAVKSQGAMKYIYRRKGAEETFRSLPRFMEGTLKHPLPGEDEESEEELESEESESEDDDNYDSGTSIRLLLLCLIYSACKAIELLAYSKMLRERRG